MSTVFVNIALSLDGWACTLLEMLRFVNASQDEPRGSMQPAGESTPSRR